jgi:hydroxymethylpyrimidine pyrophosphatase-like HAD family hydrolase
MAISLNKRSLMIMPAGVDKASGLRAAAGDLGVDLRETVGCGDAENDLPLLAACGTSVAVGNALPPVKAAATIVTTATHGDGVAEAIDRLLRTSSLSG